MSSLSKPANPIVFIDLKAQQAKIRESVERRLVNVLDHGRYIAGPEIEELERLLAARTGAYAAIACASGTAALIAPLLAQSLNERDAVFVPSFTYNATANAVILAGATPVFVDIDPNNFNMCAECLTEAVEKTKAAGVLIPRGVIPVDLFGSPADYSAIDAIAQKEGLFVLADAAQSFGGRYDAKHVGNLANISATSFFPGKALGAYGDAGAILVQDEQTARTLQSIRWHGTDDARKDSVRVGFNGRMDSFQAGVLIEKLGIFDDELAARQKTAAKYDAALAPFAKPQQQVNGGQSGYGYYSLRVDNRDVVAERLKQLGVPTAVYYRTPLHQMPAFAPYVADAHLPNTEDLSAHILSLPMHPYLSDDQVDYICAAFAQIAAEQ